MDDKVGVRRKGTAICALCWLLFSLIGYLSVLYKQIQMKYFNQVPSYFTGFDYFFLALQSHYIKVFNLTQSLSFLNPLAHQNSISQTLVEIFKCLVCS